MNIILLQASGFLDIDLHSFLLGSEKWSFLAEVALRTLVMFLIILAALRILGKRSITQLSVFELGVIIGLGSAAGDPMFYRDVGLLPGIIVFAIVVSLYRLMAYLINKSEKFEQVLEGKAVYVIEEGKMLPHNFDKETIAHEEFFSLLRQHNISHLGQIKLAIIETNGAVSIYYFPDEEVKLGLPILPHLYAKEAKQITKPGHYACTNCGLVQRLDEPKQSHTCSVCKKHVWVEAINSVRIT